MINISDINTLYDAVFEGRDVEDVFQKFSDELQLESCDENMCSNCNDQDLTSLIGVISQYAEGSNRKAGILITDEM